MIGEEKGVEVLGVEEGSEILGFVRVMVDYVN